jgi:hypothetical protein
MQEKIYHTFSRNTPHLQEILPDKNYGYEKLEQPHSVNPLTPELDPSAQRCLTGFLLGILLLEPCISLIYA